MKNTKINGCMLFRDISETELNKLLECIKPTVKFYKKGEIILSEGDYINTIGVVVSGAVQIIREDFYGNRSILAEIGVNGTFAETFPFVKVERLPVSVAAETNCEIMFIDHIAITTGCAEACGFHSKMIENLLHIIAKKNLELSEKIQHMSERNTRDKLLSYLFTQAKEAGSRDFSIPFDRQELADYLCVERSAMSNELSKLRREGIIECKKNNFKILRKQV